MSQQSVFKLLKRTKRWMNSKEIAETLGLMSPNVSLKKLVKYGEILRREARNKRNHQIYEYKTK